MKEQLATIRAQALAAFAAAEDSVQLDALRVQYLGKKGELTAVLKQMGKLSAEERPIMGQLANDVRAALEEALEAKGKEPDASAEEIVPAQIDLVIAPALACDRQGFRLGYGGGFYDRFLSRTDAACMALCAESRLVECLPREPFDRRCQFIITERRVLCTDEEQ